MAIAVAAMALTTMAFSAQGQTTNICDRTKQVQDVILQNTPANDTCDSVLISQMANIKSILDLSSKSIASLKSGDFDGLSQLFQLDLGGNDLEELPVGIFSGLSSLGALRLDQNPGADFDLPVHLQVTLFGTPESFTTASLTLTMPVGAPRPVTIPVTLAGGTPTTGSLTVPTGGVESDTLRFARGEGDFQVRTGEITLNPLGFGNFYDGFEIVEGDRSTIIATATALRIKVFLEGALE